MIKLLYFVFGTYLGSFLHVIAYRVPRGYYFLPKWSKCESCKTKLTGKDLIPLISYSLQKGKCRYCKEKIAIIHPISELIFGFLFLLICVKFSMTTLFTLSILFVSILFVLSISDIYYYILPNKFLFFLTLITFLLKFQLVGSSLTEGVASAMFAIFFLGGLLYLTSGGMGFGDYKLLIILAYFFEFTLFLQLLILSSLFALLYFYILSKRSKLSKETFIFFGPFISLAAYFIFYYYY